MHFLSSRVKKYVLKLHTILQFLMSPVNDIFSSVRILIVINMKCWIKICQKI